ncbi:site-specific integrase [Clostridium sp. SHJSY1]|uniref:tyrosine-type recombinase/integrase n=1 Tax=Clostridium sp. SHJSY1 TaxID=2942483 RepID=UPI0028764C21|nr:site-specific integrase [Clostridium sp. SHJSY1]MDS0526086.1 site-specific integrase [Clostridium sp. SHJSY1]
MPAYKDEKHGTWYLQFYFTTWTGERKKKLKRGFKKKGDALEWEREFLNKQQANPDMTFGSLVELYFDDMESRLRISTIANKKYMINLKILPYFKNMAINQIKATHIRKWQNKLMKDDKGYSETYLKSINNQLVAIFNYAVKYYNLKENPCHKAGGMGKKNADEMLFWTKEEYESFIECVSDKPQSKIAFETLYWTGMRIGELMALTLSDIDFNNNTININKSLQRIGKKDIVTAPKTPKSTRIILITDSLCNDLKSYTKTIYDIKPTDRIFPFTKFFLHHEMNRGCKMSKVKRIRLHDLRHSHASLLIELGFTPLLIAERLGHEKVETTLNTYSHLYPNKQNEVVNALQKLQTESN